MYQGWQDIRMQCRCPCDRVSGNAGVEGIILPEGVLDGIMTADDIARLNLKGADLVVLSACDTGLGSINPEGVFWTTTCF